jgi:hypothetical protein
MEWIQGVEWTPSQVFLKTINKDYQKTYHPICNLKKVFSNDIQGVKENIGTVFSNWRRLTANEINILSKQLRFDSIKSDHAHFSFFVNGKKYIVPAGVLICGIFRPFSGISKYLFSPQGLDDLCMPYGNCISPKMMFFLNSRYSTGIQVEAAQGILNSLSWMHCFPSALQMWNSVLDYSKKGQLDLNLPSASITCFANGRLLESGDVMVSELRIRLLESFEMPFEHFSKHSRVIEFERILHKINSDKKKKLHPKDLSIPLRGGQYKLTDSEWDVLQGDMIQRNVNGVAHNCRRIIDMQLEKLSQGLTWKSVASKESDLYVCHNYLKKWKADGRWRVLIDTLTKLRNSAEDVKP